MKPNDSAYLHHISDAVKALEKYISSHTFIEFAENEWDQAAVVKYLEIIAEASNQMSEELKSVQLQIPWRKIANFRNILIHEYFDVDLKLVWKILIKDIPLFKKEIKKLLSLIPTQPNIG